MPALLEQELATYEKLKPELLSKHVGKFALIKGDLFIDAFDTAENAYRAGIEKFGREVFLVKRISDVEEVYRNQALALGLMNARL